MKDHEKKDDGWRWPEHGHDVHELRDTLKRSAAFESPYDGDSPAFCYPGTPIVRDALAVTDGQPLFALQPNNIGTHTQEAREREGGFEGPQAIEADAIWMAADIVGGTKDTVDGYFCGGATEGNIAGMWIAREWLRRHPDPMQRGIIVLCTPLTHYSIHKATAMLDIGQASPRYALCSRCHREHLFMPDPTGRGVALVGMNERWEMDIGELRRIFKLCYKDGFRRFIIVPTIGTTATGSVDSVAAIGAFVQGIHRTTHARCYMHVDAAFGGFTVPFVQQNCQIGFDVPEVMSLTLDADKMGQLPYPAGIFLCRKDLQQSIGRQVTYIRGHEDNTVSGSRSAIPALFAWFQFRADGRAGQRAYVHRCLTARNRLVTLIQQHLPWATVHRYSEVVNILPVELPIDGDHGDVPHLIADMHTQEEYDALAPEARACAGYLAGYQLRADYVPSDPKDPESCPRIVYKLCIMPHTFAVLPPDADGEAPLSDRLEYFVQKLAEAKVLWDTYVATR
ncbi:MAG: pyridoxal-dependent decarboxylase [bacterium]|nr:pyridoxal-dependent decarboxylase [bacterium]